MFEWEERKGIAPESSTIALLNNSGQQHQTATATVPAATGGGGGGGSSDSPNNTLKRCHSEGSIPDSANGGGSSMPKAGFIFGLPFLEIFLKNRSSMHVGSWRWEIFLGFFLVFENKACARRPLAPRGTSLGTTRPPCCLRS